MKLFKKKPVIKNTDYEKALNDFAFNKHWEEFHRTEDPVLGTKTLIEQNRILISSINKNTSASKRWNLISIFFSVAMFILAISTIIFTLTTSKHSNNWRNDQDIWFRNIDNSIKAIPNHTFQIKADTTKKEGTDH